MKELSLRPYTGRLFVTKSRKEYERQHKKLFKTPDVLTCSTVGRFSGGEGKDGIWTYLVIASNPHTLAHELVHILMHVWGICDMDPRDSGGEAFCYMLGQLMLEASE